MEIMNCTSMTAKEKNELVKQYEPLVNKLVKQFSTKVALSWSEIKSMAYEGLALAIEKYDENRSDMTFTQYAAFYIRNNILTCLDNELRTVKMSFYAQKKAKDAGESLFTTVSIETSIRQDDDNKKPMEIKLGMVSNETFSDGDVFEYLYTRLEEKFAERDCKIFYKVFGLKEYDVEKGSDIAKEFGISGAMVSVVTKRMVEWIRKDTDLCEMLSNLLER